MVVKSAESGAVDVRRQLLAKVLSVDANGLVKVIFTENIIPKETKDLKIVD